MVIFQVFSLVSFPLMWRQIAHASKYLKHAGRTINRTGLIVAVSVAVFSAVLVTVFMIMGLSDLAGRTSSSHPREKRARTTHREPNCARPFPGCLCCYTIHICYALTTIQIMI